MRLKTLFVNRPPIRDRPWGGGAKFTCALFDHAPSYGWNVTNQLCDNIDAIVIQDPRLDEIGVSIAEIERFKISHVSVPVIHRVNECDARKNTQEMDKLLRHASTSADVVIFVSDWLRQHHSKDGWTCEDVRVIHNGVDKSVFFPETQKGSSVTRPTRIVTAHWSDNPMKGEMTYAWIDEFVSLNSDAFSFTYIGRLNRRLHHSHMIPPLDARALAAELRNHDVFVNASLFDPGPNSTLEAIASGLCTFVHKDGGGSVEFAGTDHTFGSHDELRDLFLSRRYERNAYEPSSWKECVARYVDVIEGVR